MRRSWLKRIETVFGIIMGKVVRQGNFPSVENLEDKLRQFLDYYNATMAHPFHCLTAAENSQKSN
jgi:hypothetical protein